MSRHSTGLQPLNLIMTLVSFLVSSIVVGVRVWKRLQKGSFASGMISASSTISVLTKALDELLIVIAQILAIGLTVATCTCKFVSPRSIMYTNVSCSY